MTPPLLSFGVGAALALLMLAVAVSDWRRYRVPDKLTALALALRAFDLVVDPHSSAAAAEEAALRAATMATLFYLFRALYARWRGVEGMGLGDVKLAAVAGAWVDWRLLPYVVEFAAVFGLGLAWLRGWRAGGVPRAGMKLPFAVGFAPAIFLGWQLQHLDF